MWDNFNMETSKDVLLLDLLEFSFDCFPQRTSEELRDNVICVRRYDDTKFPRD
jgi:hypothetical protein